MSRKMKPPKLTWGACAKRARLRAGWSQKKLAEAMGVSQPYIRKLEGGGQSHGLTEYTIKRVAKALNLSVADLIEA